MPPLRHKLLNQLHDLARQEQKRRQEILASYDWSQNARCSQKIPPGNWKIWLILAGRGFGKTRTGAETIRHWIQTKQAKRICLLGNTLNEVRNIMIEGISGLLNVHPPEEKLTYQPSRHQIIWPNGAIATSYSASSYEKMRGPQFDGAWIDELAKFSYAQESWDQLMFSLRLGYCPRVIITTTPRPIPLLQNLIHRTDIVITTGNTFENSANLSPTYLENIQKNYGHTRLGAQEIEGQLLTFSQGTLWTESMLNQAKIPRPETPLTRIVVAIDPAMTCKSTSDETGIIIAGIDREKRAHVLEDLSGKLTIHQWASRAIDAYQRYQADRIVAEVNNGGDLVEKILRTINTSVSYTPVRATRGKQTRAEPVAALYEQNRVIHRGSFPQLEKQMLYYGNGSLLTSPDRLDALVWALTDLLIEPTSKTIRHKIWTI